jgi:predicted component of type VI protein secretion system
MNYYPTNCRVRYQDDTWIVLDHADYVTIVNERTGRRIEVMADLLEVARY